LSWIFRQKWFWIIFLALVAIFILPFILILFVLALPGDLRLIMTILLVIGWGVAAGYRDWVKSRRKEEEEKQAKA